MATAKWVDEGEHFVADVMFGSQDVPPVLYLGLYKVPTSAPAETVTLTDFTEPSGNGYVRKTLLRGSWSVVGAYAEYAIQTFLASGGDWGDIYGYFLATSLDNSGKVLSIVHFDSPMSVVDGKGIKITPKITVS